MWNSGKIQAVEEERGMTPRGPHFPRPEGIPDISTGCLQKVPEYQRPGLKTRKAERGVDFVATALDLSTVQRTEASET